MAYNREWDRGKADTASYPNTYEDDYYSQGKRRKFNSGGYQVQDDYDESGYDNSYQQGRQIHSQDHSQDRSRSGNPPKKRMQASEPSPHVIFLGLDPDFSEADLQAFLNSKGCSVETVTIIRERSTGASKGFGFAQFTSSEHARAFVDPLFPFITVPPPASHGALAAQAFYKAVDSGAPHNGRRVKIDYSQSASPHEKGRFNNRGEKNEGTRDIGNSQAPVLLFRGLDPLSGPQAIHQAMKSSAGSGKEGGKGMKRIILIKDKVTMASFGFAFVEFIDIQSASTVLANSLSPQLHPNGFRISDRPVAASFANPESFKPIAEIMLRDEACLTSSIALGGVEGTWVRYWDDTSTVAVLEFQVAQPTQQTASNTDKEKKEKRKKVAPRPSAPAPPSALPVSDKPVTLNFKQPNKQSSSAAMKPLVLGFSTDDTLSGEGNIDDANDEDKASTSKKVAPLIASKKTVNNINKWNQVQEELSGTSTAPTPLIAQSSDVPKPESRVLQDEDDFEFSDVNGLSCLLCARQFKTMDQLKRHNKESDLHKKNYKDSHLREVARQKLQARQSGVGNNQPKYRDRASERRVLFNQPDAPVLENENNNGFKTGKKRQAEGPPPARSATPPPLNPGEDENNVGNKLLKMMGWKEGTGLGTSGDGRTEPIKTAIYAEGVGLGASKGKEIGSFTAASSGYLAMAQDSARERYQA